MRNAETNDSPGAGTPPPLKRTDHTPIEYSYRSIRTCSECGTILYCGPFAWGSRPFDPAARWDTQ